MSTWVIGDVQGCYEALRRLVEKAAIRVGHDRLWFTGDLVNRGPQSVEVLRWVRGLGESAVTVLGNHDLHLVGLALGVRCASETDTAQDVLREPDADRLIAWLRTRPIVYSDERLKTLLVHAGLLPQWSWREAVSLAQEVQQRLAGAGAEDILRRQSMPAPDWGPQLRGVDRWRAIVAAFTRLRVCDGDGRLVEYSGGLATIPSGAFAWFDAPERGWVERRVVFGHWAALGVLVRDDVVGCDSGCVWGRSLSAVCLESGQVVQVPSTK